MKKMVLSLIVLLVLLIAGGIYIDGRSGKTGGESMIGAENLVQKNVKDQALKNYGVAPEFTGVARWLGSEPLTMAGLRGRVVLVDFWTYSCINCVRTLPYVTAWYEKYKDRGFVVVGVHTPEFAFEKDAGNVETAMARYGINYPVAQDNDFATWNAYENRYWPAHYLVDQNGNIVYVHFGEGKYQEMESAIRELLGLEGSEMTAEPEVSSSAQSPEMYFGLARLENLNPKQKASASPASYEFPDTLGKDSFALEGQWVFSDEGAKLVGRSGRVRLNFRAKNVYMVAASTRGSAVKVSVDGQSFGSVQVEGSDLYALFEGGEARQGILDLDVSGPGFEAFTFTFGQ